MDRNTLIGLGLIGAIMVTFTFLNRPSEEELKKEKAKIEADKKDNEQQEAHKVAAGVKQAEDKQAAKANVADAKSATKDSTAKSDEPKKEVKEEIIRLESNKLIVDISTKGGIVAAAYLKEYESYRNFVSKSKTNVPLKLFDLDDAQNVVNFTEGGEKMTTADQNFEIISKSKKQLKLAWTPVDGKRIIYTYKLNPNAYDMDYSITQEGFSAADFHLNWEADLYKTERLLSEQRRVSTICYKYKGEDFDYLSEMADDEAKMEKDVEWLAYKQSYFTTIMKPQSGFESKGSKISIKNFAEGHEKYVSHIKKYDATMGLDLAGSGRSAKINWFFGPNDYETLKSYDSGYEDIINYGWGLFRWINIFVIQPMFNFLASTGLGFGLVILLLTLIIKLFLTPIQWKMYVSSAKMRILKPEVDALNAKFPNKEDAMKKQMEMMALYRESGASPLAGCIPMLIQMPILLAVFRFFPAAFELRQQPFLWAEDLSSYDSIYTFGTYIWPYGDHVSLFTLLMSVTTLVYTWLNSGNMQQPSQPGMPNMKVIMYIFPVMMIFFFNNYSSGLSYYYFISTLISILIMVAIKQFFVDENKLKEKMQAKKATVAAGGTKKKSKFQERLEQMQKAQQEKLKQGKK